MRLLFLFLLLPCLTIAQTSVTFHVDMNAETVAGTGVHIAGNFQAVAGLGDNWDPSATQLSDPDNDGVYSLTVTLPAATYEYKFINGNAWGQDENPPAACAVGNTSNRTVQVGGTDLDLPPVPFNGCTGSVRLAVNLRDEIVSPAGVYVVGNFQEAAGYGANWTTGSVALTDVNGDRTYAVRLQLPPGDYQYYFVNGATAEQLSSSCASLGDNGTYNRSLNVAAGQPDPPVHCFNTCTPCDPALQTDFETHWWNDAIFYELFVRSFYDSDGDGIGDFRGVIERMDYLNDGDPETTDDLGITALWLMPMLASPSYHGYDVTDYYATEPDYGNMADFEALLEEAHARGIRVIIDLVLNHTSSQHPWFTQSKNGTGDYRDWYVWSADNPNFGGPWGQTVWHNYGGDYYYGLFWGGMPDLNYAHPPVREELFNVADFWLDKGVDGFRLDAIKYLVEDGEQLEGTAATFSLLEEFDSVYTAANADVFIVGEVWSSTPAVVPYVQNDRMDACFEFDLAGAVLGAINNAQPAAVEQQMQTVLAAYPALQYGTFLTNHDMDRLADHLGGNVAKQQLAAALYLTLPGVPFLYYGEELGMTGTGVHENIRRPMQWTSGTNAGFSSSAPWIGVGSNFTSNNVAAMQADANSLLSNYRRLIRIRQAQPALRRGNYLSVTSTDDEVLSYARVHGEEAVLTVANLGSQSTTPGLSLAASTLAPGSYFVTDLYEDRALGTVTINADGGFADWTVGEILDARSSWILSLTVENPVNVATGPEREATLMLSPNPANDYVRVEVTNAATERITVRSVDGRVVYAGMLRNGTMRLHTTGWSAGVYFVVVGGAAERLVVL